jgi:ribonucleoside-diphosphate reductase alpha chain
VRDFEVGWKEFTLYPEALYPFLSEPTMKEKLESQTSMNISSKGQLQMLSAFQEYIHTGVSKTVNVPYETSKEQIKEIILDASKLKLKGFTIFRDKCREGVISQTVLQNKYEEKDELELSPMRQGTIFEVSGPVTAYVTVSRDKLSRPREVFVQVGPAGTMLNSMLSAFGRVISVALRENPELIDRFIYTLKCIESSELYNCIDDSMQLHLRSNSLPAILSQIFEYMKGEGMSQEVSLGDICPSCGKLSLFRKGGCKSCDFCGFTNC